MTNKKIIMQRFFMILVTILTFLALSCGGGGGGGKNDDGDGGNPDDPNYTLTDNVYSFGPNTDGKKVSFGACTFTGTVSGDSPVSSMATVTFNSSTGAVTITNGTGVRGYEFTFFFSGTSFSNVSFTDGTFIKTPSSGSGTLATMTWDGSSTPKLLAATLSDSDGNDIAVSIE